MTITTNFCLQPYICNFLVIYLWLWVQKRLQLLSIFSLWFLSDGNKSNFVTLWLGHKSNCFQMHCIAKSKIIKFNLYSNRKYHGLRPKSLAALPTWTSYSTQGACHKIMTFGLKMVLKIGLMQMFYHTS